MPDDESRYAGAAGGVRWTEPRSVDVDNANFAQVCGQNSQRVWLLVTGRQPAGVVRLWVRGDGQSEGIGGPTGQPHVFIHKSSYEGLITGEWYCRYSNPASQVWVVEGIADLV